MKIYTFHEPKFIGNEKYLKTCIESTFVSSVGTFVESFEKIAKYMKSRFAIATNSGTSKIHISLLLANVDQNSEVITQSLNFIAGCNAISYCKLVQFLLMSIKIQWVYHQL